MSDFFNNNDAESSSSSVLDEVEELNDATDQEISELMADLSHKKEHKSNVRTKDAWICETKHETDKKRKGDNPIVEITPKRPFTPEVIAEVQSWLIRFEKGELEIPSHREKRNANGELIHDKSNNTFCYKKLYCFNKNCSFRHSYASLLMRAFITEFYNVAGEESKSEEVLTDQHVTSCEDDIYNLYEDKDVTVSTTYRHEQRKDYTTTFTPRKKIPDAVVNLLTKLMPDFYAGKTSIPRIGIYESKETQKVLHCNGAICYAVVCATNGSRKLNPKLSPADDPNHIIHDCRKYHNNDSSLVTLLYRAFLDANSTFKKVKYIKKEFKPLVQTVTKPVADFKSKNAFTTLEEE